MTPDITKAEETPKSDTFKISLPKSFQEFFLKVSGLTMFAFRFIKEIFKPPYEIKETARQFYEIGYKSFH